MYKRKRTKYTIEHVCRKEGKSWKVDVRTKEVKAGCHLIKKKLNSWPGPLLQQITKAHRAKFSLFFFFLLVTNVIPVASSLSRWVFTQSSFPPFHFYVKKKVDPQIAHQWVKIGVARLVAHLKSSGID